MRQISIIIPIIRPDSAERCVAAIKKNAGLPIDQYEIVSDMDAYKVGCPKMVKKLVAKTKYDLVMFLGDDTIPRKDFLKHALEKMESLPDGWGVVGLNTNGKVSSSILSQVEEDIPQDSNPFAHWMAHKKMLEHIPGGDFFSLEYNHCWCDAELKDIASELGRWGFVGESRIDHIHPINRNAPNDEHYQRAYTEKAWVHDKKTYFARRRKRMKEKYGIKLAIAIPLTDEMVYRHFFFSFVKVLMDYMITLTEAGKPISFDILMPDFPCQIDAARNDLVRQALMSGCTHILMMDTDQIYSTPGMIGKMLAHNKPVLGAKVHRRYPPFDSLLLRGEIGKLYQVPDDEVKNEDGTFKTEVPVEYTGAGCILYDMKIFNDMIPDQWFQLKVGEFGQPIGEDIYFCEKLKIAGIPIVVDASIDIKHLTLLAADWGTYKLFQKIMKTKQGGKKWH